MAQQPLVDPGQDFQAVYALSYREHFGYLIGAYVVERGPGGQLTTRYARLMPASLETYAARLDDTDRELVAILNEITLEQLYRHFGGQQPSIQHFILSYQKQWDYVLDYIQRRILRALPLLADRPFYRMSRDGYPAWKPLQLRTDRAELRCRIEHGGQELRLSLQPCIDDQPLTIGSGPSGMLTRQPVWMVHQHHIFTFEPQADARLLQPFFQAPGGLAMPLPLHESHRRLLTEAFETFRIEAEGVQVEERTEVPAFVLALTQDQPRQYTFRLWVSYGPVTLPLQPDRTMTARVENQQTDVQLHLVHRDPEREAEQAALLQQLSPQASLFDHLTLSEIEAFTWLHTHRPTLKAAGISIDQTGVAVPLAEDVPRLETDLRAVDGGYEVVATVQVGAQSLPFNTLKSNVLEYDPRLPLPDGSITVLPERWLQEFRHFFEIATPLHEGFRLEQAHATLLDVALRELGQAQLRVLEAAADPQPQPLPDKLKAELRDYQQEGYNWLCFLQAYGLGGILADDMGLGKTVQILTLLLREKEAGRAEAPSLVVVPNSLVFNWKDEVKKFTPALKILNYTGPRRHKLLEKAEQYDLILTTYGLIPRDLERLLPLRFHYVVLDESHVIKNRDSQLARAVFQLRSRHRLSVTGTPIENTTMDLWSQMHFLNPGLLGSESFFEKQYRMPIEKEGNTVRAERLRQVLGPVILRRTKEMVAWELPPRQEQILYCDMLPEQKAFYNDTRRHYRATLYSEATEKIDPRQRMQIFSSLQRLRQIAIHPRMIDPMRQESGKYDEMKQLLDVVLAEGSKVLIFSQFVKLLTLVKYDLIQRGIPFSYIDGGVRDREREVRRFQDRPEVQVFLISLKAGGTGLNLTAAEYVFLLDPWWNPAIEQQAINRAHRIGQTRPVFVYRFITRNSIEEKMLQMQRRKSALAADLIHTETAFLKSLTPEDFRSFFE